MEYFERVDASTQESITDAQVSAFRQHGFLIVENLLCSEELGALRLETQALIEHAKLNIGAKDHYYSTAATHGQSIPYRIEYIAHKAPSCRSLLAHPFLLRTIVALQGPAFVPTWDSLVFKLPDYGAEHEWHRDACPYYQTDLDTQVAAIDIGVYLDDSDVSNCLYVIPGSNHWSEELFEVRVTELERAGFNGSSAVPILVRAGGAILHNILTVHGSPPSQSGLRRTIYYEFRQVAAEEHYGPHTPEYVLAKQRMLLSCVCLRQNQPFATGENGFVPYSADPCSIDLTIASDFRYPHEKYWRYYLPFSP